MGCGSSYAENERCKFSKNRFRKNNRKCQTESNFTEEMN